MKKLFAVIALIALFGTVSQAQTTSTDNKPAEKKQEVKYCTEAEKAACEKECSKTGAKCVTTDAKTAADTKTEKSCSSSKGGSCCSKGTTSAGSSCCQKGGATGSTATESKKKEKVKTVAQATEKK